MKTTVKVMALIAALTAASQGSTTISGTVGTVFKAADGVTNIASGSLVLLIADTGNGFLSNSSSGALGASLNGKSGVTLDASNISGLTIGSTFGGDTIVNVLAAGGTGSIASPITGASNINITPYANDHFALVWFTQSAASVAANLNGQAFGIMSLQGWSFPASDGNTYTMSTTPTAGVNYQSVPTGTGQTGLTATQLGATGLFSGTGTAANSGSTAVRAAEFSVVPEPSAAILGAFGVLGLLRRRRN